MMAAPQKQRKKRLLNLYMDSRGKCHYCGIDTTLPPPNAGSKYHKPTTATIEHIYPRTDIRRLLQSHYFENTVLACFECNQHQSKMTDPMRGVGIDKDFSLIKLLENEQNTY